jgi:glycosyltransferase involved in cell wall biosynthesis
LNIVLLVIKPLLSRKTRIIVRESNTLSIKNSSLVYPVKFIHNFLYKLFYKKSNLIIAQCQEMKNDLIKYLKIKEDKIKVIYNPLEINKIIFQTNGDNPYLVNKINFLGVGRLTKQKGFDILIRAFSIVVKEIPNSHLTILGEGELLNELENLAYDLGLNNKISFEGFKINPYIYYYYSDTYVLSSRWEGFPNSLLEALACKAKVVSTKCKSGPNEIIGNNEFGILSELNDIELLAENMIKSIYNENLSGDRALKFDIGIIIKEYEECLKSII